MADTLRSLFTSQKGSTSGGAAGDGDDASATGASSAVSQEVKPNVTPGASLRILGSGGGGSNAVKRMIESKVDGVDFISVNTDMQALYHNPAGKKITIGRGTTRGLGAGSNPDVGSSKISTFAPK